MAKGKGFEMVLKLKAQLDKAVPESLQKISKDFNNLKNRQKELNNVSKLMPKHLQKHMLEYKKINSKLQMLNKLKRDNNGLSKEQEKEYKTLTRAQEKLGKVVDKERKAYSKYSLELQKLKIPHDQLQKELKQTGLELERVTKKQKLFNSVSNFKKKAGNATKKALVTGGKIVAGAAIAGTLGAGYFSAQSASEYADFEGQMKRVQAISGATKQEFKLLEKEALKLGATTSFTSQEAAAGMEKFALAGFKTKDIIASMPGMLNLAAASGEDLALVSDIVSDNMTAFKLNAQDAGKIADIFAYTMSKTNTTVGMLGEAFKYVAPSASGLNVSIEQTSALLGLLADKGIKGSQAGTGLNAMFSKLLKESKEFNNLGIDIKDSKGKFLSVDKILKQFDTFFKKEKMDPVQIQTFLVKAFGEQGYRVAQSLLDGSKEINGVVYNGVERITAQIGATYKESLGKAEQMKETMLEGVDGTRTLFLSAVDGLKMAIGKTIFTEATLKSIKTATNYVSEFGLVLRGEFSDNPINKFWQNIFEKVNLLITTFKNVLSPGFESLKAILMDPSMVKFFKMLGKAFLTIAYIGSYVFTKIAQGLELVNKYIGIDNILIFIAAFSGVGKIIGGISFLIGKIIALKSSITLVGGTVSYLKILFTTLGGPVVWIGAAIATLIYLFHKFGGVKANLLGIWEVFKQWIVVLISIGDFFYSILNPFKLIYDLGISFWSNWDSSKGIIENLKNGFFGFFDGVTQRIIKIGDNFLSLGDKIKNIPIVGALLDKLGFGNKEPKPDGSHRTGLKYVPRDGYIAELHKGERVLTADENRSFGESMLFDLRNNQNAPGSFNHSNKNSSSVSISIGDIVIKIDQVVTNNAEEMAKIIAEEGKKIREKLLNDLRKEFKDGQRTAF